MLTVPSENVALSGDGPLPSSSANRPSRSSSAETLAKRYLSLIIIPWQSSSSELGRRIICSSPLTVWLSSCWSCSIRLFFLGGISTVGRASAEEDLRPKVTPSIRCLPSAVVWWRPESFRSRRSAHCKGRMLITCQKLDPSNHVRNGETKIDIPDFGVVI